MMDLFTWFLQKSASVLALSQSKNSEFFLAYMCLVILINRPVYLLAFFMSCLLFELKVFDQLNEVDLYLITFVIYSYVYICCETIKSKFACAIILLITIIFAVDSALYGINGYYGAHETIIYRNIESLAVYAHSIFIASLVPYRRILNYLLSIVNNIVYFTRYNAYLFVF